ncbi:uncharacterized protein LOC117901263 [Drosophila subobscura]|uniref:uncharacterized protein LOC117901263 n=1 Tax=Drosophila subobscura TaxID=7241 RepID=UPI00155B25EB|nr:uncharacterized protein LOC117901263 [Drosophila subobscura]
MLQQNSESMLLQPIGVLVIAFALQLTVAVASPARGDSLRELRKLMRQQQDNEQQVTATPLKQFNEDINQWAMSLEQLGHEIYQFVSQCRQPGSQCQQRRVQRKFRSLRHGYTELRARLEALQVHHMGGSSNEEELWIIDSSMQKVKMVLKEYDETLRLINGKIYKMVEQ